MATGFNNVNKDDLWQYDPVANSWIQKANFPGVARRNAVGFALGNYGYVGTGWRFISPSSQNDFYRYDPSGNSWTLAATFPGGGRMYSCATVLGNSAYMGTGYRDTVAILNNDWWRFDVPTGIVEINNISELNIYPNPMTTEATIEFPVSGEKLTVVIFDHNGKKVSEFSHRNNKTKISKGSLVNGVYEVVLRNVKGQTVAQNKLLVNGGL
ncbi:MAG: T9SS type A sorting domain-containing protein [Bacteroidota bacterium]|nr:T9SS type A sorting domain-containing protein [Bacteroidota bacterium]